MKWTKSWAAMVSGVLICVSVAACRWPGVSFGARDAPLPEQDAAAPEAGKSVERRDVMPAPLPEG